jgi:hypothetical protein
MCIEQLSFVLALLLYAQSVGRATVSGRLSVEAYVGAIERVTWREFRHGNRNPA